jgi:hypothetical protein
MLFMLVPFLAGDSGDGATGVEEVRITAEHGRFLGFSAPIVLAIARLGADGRAGARGWLTGLARDFASNPASRPKRDVRTVGPLRRGRDSRRRGREGRRRLPERKLSLLAEPGYGGGWAGRRAAERGRASQYHLTHPRLHDGWDVDRHAVAESRLAYDWLKSGHAVAAQPGCPPAPSRPFA